MRDGDVVLFFNFRADRARQLSVAFLNEDFTGFDREGWPRVHYVTLTQYDAEYTCPHVFPPQTLNKILGEVVGAAGKRQLRIAETEKYPHVTYFFNGGVEEPKSGRGPQDRPFPESGDLRSPAGDERRARDRGIARRAGPIRPGDPEFRQPDMVGHTGVVEAAIKAVETVDTDVGRVIERVLELGGKALVTADHGNCEYMRNPDGSPNTAHTTNLVHLFYVAEDAAGFELKDGILADIAPTLLHLLGIEPPSK